ncbi:MAG: zinc metallopeptidase, partial [Candidatus Atribacteria bacterium]|nr:zinc metallopeptidase [Candidatus Atribacteria bacterium]
MFFFPFDYTFILLIPALILAFYAQAKVSSTYSKLSRKRASAGLSGREVAEMLVESLGLRVKVEEIPGALT